MVIRGEVWLATLDPTVGSEIRKTRPYLIVSPPEMHDHLRTAIVAPMTTGARSAPYRIPVTFGGKKGSIGRLPGEAGEGQDGCDAHSAGYRVSAQATAPATPYF